MLFLNCRRMIHVLSRKILWCHSKFEINNYKKEYQKSLIADAWIVGSSWQTTCLTKRKQVITGSLGLDNR